MSRTNINNLSAEIMRQLEAYGNTTAEKVKEAVKEVAKDTKKELQRSSPKKSGQYAKKWKTTVRKENAAAIEISVHDAKYQISHLLENGHAKRGGGRVPPVKHIKPAEERAKEELEEKIRRSL